MKTVAILGASSDPTKYGHAAVLAFTAAGWTVFPVNPREKAVAGWPAFSKIEEVPQPLDWISVYLPPKVGVSLLPELVRVKAGEIWFNPGAADAALIQAARLLGLKITTACSIRAIGKDPGDFL